MRIGMIIFLLCALPFTSFAQDVKMSESIGNQHLVELNKLKTEADVYMDFECGNEGNIFFRKPVLKDVSLKELSLVLLDVKALRNLVVVMMPKFCSDGENVGNYYMDQIEHSLQKDGFKKIVFLQQKSLEGGFPILREWEDIPKSPRK
jgi:hypothetical protein